MNEPILFILMLFLGLYLFARLRDLAAQARKNQLTEEIVREVVKKAVQKRRLDELYGRTPEDEDR